MTEQTEQLTDRSLDRLRSAIAQLVPHAMERAVASYRAFVTVAVPLEAKEFKDHHTAGRTALAHLETLLRLARWAALPAGVGEQGHDQAADGEAAIDAMLADASRALAAMRAGLGDGGLGENAGEGLGEPV